MKSEALEGTTALLQPCISTWKYLTFYQCLEAVEWEQAEDHKTYNREHGYHADWQICLPDLHVTTARPEHSHSHVVFGCAFPIDYLAGRDGTGGEGWESGSGRACAAEVFSDLAGCGQLDQWFEFLLTERLKFQPLKIEGNKRLASQNNLSV